MKMLRLLGLAAALTVVVFVEARPAFAFCSGPCPNDNWCKNCFREPDAVCLGGHCAV